MKKRATFLVVVLFSLCISSIYCKKSSTSVKAKTPEQILTSTPWKIAEITAAIGNLTYYYNRGGSANTVNFDNEYIVFRIDNTGTYAEDVGSRAEFTWSFSNTAKTKITLTGQLLPSSTIYWEDVVLTDTSLKYNERYTVLNVFSSATVERIPK